MSAPQPPPNPLADPFVPAVGAYALITAVSIGLFSALADRPRSAEELSTELGLRAAAVERLAAVLVAMGYLNRDGGDGGVYGLAEVSRMTLLPGSPHSLRNWVEFSGTQLQAVSRMKEVLGSDQGVDLYDLMSGDQERLTHQRAMAETAAPAAESIASQVELPPGPRRMLDVGGSHGLYSAAICRRNPPLVSDVIELPAILPFARAVAAEYGADEYVTYLPGDVEQRELTQTYDLIFLGNIVHHFAPERLRRLLHKLSRSSSAEARIVIWDIDDRRDSDELVSACFSLFFHLTSGARCHAESELADLLRAAGFGRLQVVRTPQPSTHVLTVARRSEA
jgi:hypothetical protein